MTPDPDGRITDEHRTRLAMVYVRQSSPDQVRSHVESRRVQIGLRERAIAYGWSQPIVIDEDLGVSAGGFAHRPGFQQLLGRIALREVGIIFCIDASRLSRNSKDWAHLFELCGYFDTLIADLEQVYDLKRPNDRLVMGIKGTLSEMELTILRTRLRTGFQAKAARGELKINLPAGYIYDLSDRIVFDPDQRIQAAIRMMFDQFDRCTSVRQLAMWYHDTNTLFPVRVPRKHAPTNWEIPTAKTLHKLLVHPIYAGAYVHGRRITRVEYANGKLIKRVSDYLPLDRCQVCIRDHHDAYIPWQRLLSNRAKITDNRPRWNMQENRGAIRDGSALLAGLLRCGQCGGKIYVGYKNERATALYYCDGGNVKGSKRCLAFGSHLIDQRVGEEVCHAVQPLAVDAAVAAADQEHRDQQQEVEAARMQVQAAQYEVDRAFEQFDLVDPKNRLVADTLEARFNAKLADLKTATDKLDQVSREHVQLTDEQRGRLQTLARNFHSVWNHSSADPPLKKRLLRAAIFEILVTHQPDQQRLEVTIHWQGGTHTRFHVKKKATPRGHKADPSLVALVDQLARDGLDDAEITRILNMKKIETPHALRWTLERVEQFRKHHRIASVPGHDRRDTLTQNQTAAYLGISRNALQALVNRGAVSINQITDFAPWRVSRQQLDSEDVQRLVRTLKATGRLPKGGCPKQQRSLFHGS